MLRNFMVFVGDGGGGDVPGSIQYSPAGAGEPGDGLPPAGTPGVNKICAPPWLMQGRESPQI